MASPIEPAAYKDAVIILASAAIIVPALSRLRLNPLIGFLLAGLALGPQGLGAFVGAAPWLGMVTITTPGSVEAVAEIGIVFLLFLIGLELSFERLTLMKKLVFGMGGAQMLLSAAAIGGLVHLLGLGAGAAIVVGVGLAMSSTAMVVELLSRQKRMASGVGRSSFSILLFQDLAFVPAIVVAGILSAGVNGPPFLDAAFGLLEGALAVVVLIVLGRRVLRPIFSLVASTTNSELFIAAAVLVALGTGVATAAFGFSMALGAFIAGLLLAETEYRKAIEATIEPFKSLLLGVFFFSVGMKIDPSLFLQHPLALLGGVAGLLAVKAAILAPLVRSFGFPRATALKTALLLAPAGEFAFPILAVAMAGGLLDAATGGLVVTIVAFGMALTPLLDMAGRAAAGRAAPPAGVPPEPTPPGHEVGRPVAVVIGAGRVGRLVSDMLRAEGVAHLLVDRDARVVAAARREGRPVHYGEADQPRFLELCGVGEARALIISIDTASDFKAIIAAAQAVRPDICIIARARDARHAEALYASGASVAVPETIEASLQLSEAALVEAGVPMGRVIAAIHDRRDAFRAVLRAKAGRNEPARQDGGQEDQDAASFDRASPGSG